MEELTVIPSSEQIAFIYNKTLLARSLGLKRNLVDNYFEFLNFYIECALANQGSRFNQEFKKEDKNHMSIMIIKNSDIEKLQQSREWLERFMKTAKNVLLSEENQDYFKEGMFHDTTMHEKTYYQLIKKIKVTMAHEKLQEKLPIKHNSKKSYKL